MGALVTVLPDREEILDRLIQADPELLARQVYPAVQRLAGRRMVGVGVSVGVIVAIAESSACAAEAAALRRLAPRLVDALLDDDRVRGDALGFLGAVAG